MFMSTFASSNANENSTRLTLNEAVRHYCMSVELCDGYLRGLYGLKVVSSSTKVWIK